MVGSSNCVGSLPKARSYRGAVDGRSVREVSESDGEAAVSMRSMPGLPGSMTGDGGGFVPGMRKSAHIETVR